MRISKFLTAEELAEPYKIESGRSTAVEVDGDFTWEVVPSALVQAAKAGFAGRGEARRGAGRGGHGGRNGKRQSWLKSQSKKGAPTLPVSNKDADTTGSNEGHEEKEADSEKEVQKLDEKPFELKGLKMSIPKGAFVGIVGRVGSGKVRTPYSCYKRG